MDVLGYLSNIVQVYNAFHPFDHDHNDRLYKSNFQSSSDYNFVFLTERIISPVRRRFVFLMRNIPWQRK